MVKALKSTMKQLRSEQPMLKPHVCEQLAAMAQNNTEHIKGFIPAQWAYGCDPSQWNQSSDPLQSMLSLSPGRWSTGNFRRTERRRRRYTAKNLPSSGLLGCEATPRRDQRQLIRWVTGYACGGKQP